MFKSKSFWWTLLVAWLVGSSYWHVCQIRQLCGFTLIPSLINVNYVSQKSLLAQTLKDSIERTLHSRRNNDFSFAISGYTPDTNTIGDEIDTIIQRMAANSSHVLNIKGGYLNAENNKSPFPNLGIARAEQIKYLIVSRGIPTESVKTSGIVAKEAFIYGDSITGIIKMEIAGTAPVVETAMVKDQKFEILFKPIDLYFSFGSSDYVKTPENQDFLALAKIFLSSNPKRKLILTGHTDNEDSAEWNMQLSIKRASSIRKKLIALGISGDQILALGKGETEPKESNSTLKGKRANRRVTMVVQ